MKHVRSYDCAWIKVNLDALVENWNYFSARARPGTCAAVVKANGYGLGAKEVALALSNAGCKWFFVATLAEGISLRRYVPHALIGVFHGFFGKKIYPFVEHNLSPALISFEAWRHWSELSPDTRSKLKTLVMVDLGISRLGIGAREFIDCREQWPSIPDMVLTHFSSADTPETSVHQRESEIGRQLRTVLPGDCQISLANSAAAWNSSSSHVEVFRPGVALYGATPVPEMTSVIQPVVSVFSRIIQLRRVGKGEYVGYNATWISERDSLIATIGFGYADGISRSAGRQSHARGGVVEYAGQQLPIVGRISMDVLTCDMTDARRTPEIGDPVTIVGGALTIDKVAGYMGTISYELLTGLSIRTPRIYKLHDRGWRTETQFDVTAPSAASSFENNASR